MRRVKTGLDHLVEDRYRPLQGQRVGLIANPTTIDSCMRHLVDLLHEAPGVTLAAVFGPEHGVRGDAQDMIGVGHEHDRRTGVPAYSLYGANVASLTPTVEQLEGLDVLVFDVQDVGSRYYTFAATMLFCMKAAEVSGLKFVVLDRPNPIGGLIIEGPLVQPGFESFVGAYPMPIRHGMTVGELALMFKSEMALDLELTVISCSGWHRAMYWPETGIPWVAPSPNMPTPETALVYPGGCLIEGTNLSEGRGTTRPFELWGAPGLDAYAICAALSSAEGALLRAASFRPMFHKYQGQVCQGVEPHVTDPTRFRSVVLYTAMIALARLQSLDHFEWRTETYEFISDPIAIDLLFGSSRERQLIESLTGVNHLKEWMAALIEPWTSAELEFARRREEFLLYK